MTDHHGLNDPIRHYGLLYIDRTNNYNPNTRKNLFGQELHDPIDLYILNAATCARSAACFGLSFTLITNNAELINTRIAALRLQPFSVVEQDFRWDIPKSIPFYAAHFKLEVIEAFGMGVYGKNIALIDIDTVFLSAPPPLIDDSPNTVNVYDISTQMFPAHGQARMQRELCDITGLQLQNPSWFGGEYISGNYAVFSRISKSCKDLWRNYVARIAALSHIGDETIVSAALNSLAEEGVKLNDYGRRHNVARWFTSLTMHKQEPLNAVLADCSLLHLPSDKEFLATRANESFQPETFAAAFIASKKNKILVRQLHNCLTNPFRLQKKYAPTL